MLISQALKQLLGLLADGQFHSGTQLADALGISRSAIWKHLQALAEFGIEFSAVSGKGYKLSRPLQLLDKQIINNHLQEQAAGLITCMDIHDSLDSTNNYVMELARQGCDSGLVCLAEYQTAGKGRRGRHWQSPFGQNIYLSILWRYQDGPAAISGLSLALGVAVIRALSELGVTDAGLKWPNDIYRQARKLGGILVEVSGETTGPCWAVVGLGINLKLSAQQAAPIDQPWTDLTGILGETAYSQRNKLIGLLLNQLLPMIAAYNPVNLPPILAEWRRYDCMLGKAVQLYLADQIYSGFIAGIDDAGLLLLDTDAGVIRSFASGEVSLRAT